MYTYKSLNEAIWGSNNNTEDVVSEEIEEVTEEADE